MDLTFYMGFGIAIAFMITIIIWLVKDYRKEKKDYPFKHKKEK
jgi:hypothetical protein